MSWWTVATITELVWVFAMALGIVLDRRSPVATIAWIAVLSWLPLVGVAIYFFFGPRRLKRRNLKRASAQKLLESAVKSIADESEHPIARSQLARLVVGAGEAAPLRATSVDVYFDGADTYGAVFAAIDAAKHHIHVASYIYEPGQVGDALRDKLTARAKAGVEVRLLIDSVGSSTLRSSYFRALTSAGGELAWFNPVLGRRFNPRMTNFRSHRKIVVCDGLVGFTGGMNVADCQSSAVDPKTFWRDTHVRVEGSAVRALARVFLEDWYFATEKVPPLDERYLTRDTPTGEHFVQFVASGPDKSTFAIQKLYFGAVTSARERVWLSTPYFVPDEALTLAIVTAALRGVDVRLLVPEHGDNLLVDLAARSYFPDLLRVGAQVLEYTPRFLHAKTCVVDDDLSIVGTANLDTRSFKLNFECVAAIYGEEVNAKLAAAFERDLASARPVKNKELRREPFVRRAAEAVARLFSPTL